MRRLLLLLVLLFLSVSLAADVARPRDSSGLSRAIATAERALAGGELDVAEAAIQDALERDPRSAHVWHLKATWARAASERDHEVYALHRELALRVAQRLSGAGAVRARILEVDPIAKDLFGLETKYAAKLRPIADKYDKDGWPHGAIAVHREILVLAPEDAESTAAIERLSSAPDPSLAGDAKSRDLLANVSAQWIAEHDAKHSDWKTRAILERDNYVTHTDAGYEVMVRAAEAMEQMSTFYRTFFRFGHEEKTRGKVPRIELRIFKSAEEYLELGSGPPAAWSGGQFTGGAVETYVGESGFEDMTGTLFHEAAHQFVSLATSAAGWLNEGLASFFEGSRILANGSVRMNEPANHRLFPLVERMEAGWMADAKDGIGADPEVVPPRAPTLRIVVENDYEWGPAWYGPTWGLVYFLHNFQDPADGRFVYRKAFREYVDRSGGLSGTTAIGVFEEVVLGRPQEVTREVRSRLSLPRTIDELNELWKDWLTDLRDEQTGKRKPSRPWKQWAEYAMTRLDIAEAQEHFEKGLEESPEDVELLVAFGEYLVNWSRNEDRAVKLFRSAERALAKGGDPEGSKGLGSDVDRWLRKLDPQRAKLEKVREGLIADAKMLPRRYLDERLERMAMDVAWRLGREMQIEELFDLYATAIETEGESLALWQLAYNEENLDGWADAGQSLFTPEGPYLDSSFGTYQRGKFEYRFLTLDAVTSGDFSMEAEVQGIGGEVAFSGLVFGKKSSSDFHALVLFPPHGQKKGYADLATFYGGDSHETWRHEEVGDADAVGEDPAGKWHRLRVDVTGASVDMWVDGQFLATQEFPSAAVLRGSFGLITGLGKSRFREVRYLARDPVDPAARTERALRMQDHSTSDTSNNGSWLGKVPPFPATMSWIQGTRASWDEFAGQPQLLVMWSCDQNDALRIDKWLLHLDRQYGPLGLQFVNVVHTWDSGQAEEYIRINPFPGAIALDARPKNGYLGETFTAYAIERFQLPRLILLDVDGTVAWEGDPGFTAGIDWVDESTFLDAPLTNLIRGRKLAELARWRTTWKDARVALSEARFADSWPVLAGADEYDGRIFRDVAEALAIKAELETAVASFDESAAELSAAGRDPAALVLADWAETMGTPAPAKTTRALKGSADAKAWARALSVLQPSLRRIDGGKDPELNDKAFERLAAATGSFAVELHAALVEAQGDAEATKELCLTAEVRPARWLAREHFGW